jgi:hypothetical protein
MQPRYYPYRDPAFSAAARPPQIPPHYAYRTPPHLQEFLRVAYPHPEIVYQYYHDDERLYYLPAQTLQERLLALHPTLSPADLIPIYEETPFSP